MDESADDLIGKHLRDMAAEGMTARQAADALGMGYAVVWRRAARRGIKFRRSDGSEARSATWATKLATAAADELPDEGRCRPVKLSDEVIAALYRGRRYQDATLRRWPA